MSDTVGYTNDGMVFMKLDHLTDQGEPLSTTILWKPKVAMEMGKFLIEASQAAAAQKENEGQDNDSTSTNRGRT